MKTYSPFLLTIIPFIASFLLWIDNVEASSLQQMVANAQNGEVITLQGGTYDGPLVIDKPITIIGEGEVVITSNHEATISIIASGVQLKNIEVHHEATNLSSTAIYIEGNRNEISEVTILTKAMGITLNNANENVLNSIAITGPYKTLAYQSSMDSREGNAIDLFRANNNEIKNVKVEYAQDGIYIESSQNNEVSHCDVRHSRYGFHLMFTSHTKLTNNLSTENITGMMVMGTEGTEIYENVLTKMNAHVYSQGLMLYDVHHARIEKNRMEQNLIGILVESSENNVLKNNVLASNYIGVQFIRTNNNEFVQNDLIANVIRAYGSTSDENVMQNNYWDGHEAIDFTGDGKNDWPYYADPIFPILVMKKPAYQIFADSPGMNFFSFLLDIDKGKLLKDDSPNPIFNVHETNEFSKGKWSLGTIYALITMFMTIIIYVGGRRI